MSPAGIDVGRTYCGAATGKAAYWAWPGMMVRRVTTRRTRWTVRARATTRRAGVARLTTRWRIFGTLRTCWTCGRLAVVACVTCMPPAPINAPPQVQAHNLAKAIRTDISIPHVRGPTRRPQSSLSLHTIYETIERLVVTSTARIGSAHSSHGLKRAMDATALTIPTLPKPLPGGGFGRIRDRLSQYNTIQAKNAGLSQTRLPRLRRASRLL